MNTPLSHQHLAAIERPRRIIFQDDVLANDAFRSAEVGQQRLARIVDYYMSRLDEQPNQIDSVWYEWGEGNTAVWPSQILPRTENVFPQWWRSGIDPVAVLLDEARKRGREVFFSYRINGSDNDPDFDPPHPYEQPIPLKARHPDWLIRKWHPYWDFSFQGVRDLKLEIIREVAAMYDFDGIHIDFARIPVLFPEGRQWTSRDALSEFMREVRAALLAVAKRRGRPLLLAARVAENLAGCHFDGIDIETWVREELVDILVLGTRTANIDIAAFRRLCAGTSIKLYPSWDDHHSSDGYREPDLEIWRGVCANWWQQNPDGMHTFNLMLPSPQAAQNMGLALAPRWPIQRRVFAEIGNSATLAGKDKIFFVERRGGGHGEAVVPAPTKWHTPRHMYFQTNMRAPLPVAMADDGKTDALLILDVADAIDADAIDHLTLRIAISTALPLDELPIRIRINNIPLDTGRAETITTADAFQDWLVFAVPPQTLALGANLVGVGLDPLAPDFDGPSQIEKLELHVRYKAD